MAESWLLCLWFRGMFSDECAVKYDESSFFVPASAVNRTDDQKSKVKVRVFKKDNALWAVLPTVNQDIIRIRPQDLVSA
jgi:hypothetical protein